MNFNFGQKIKPGLTLYSYKVNPGDVREVSLSIITNSHLVNISHYTELVKIKARQDDLDDLFRHQPIKSKNIARYLKIISK
jgi:hypothetical protein